MAAGGIIPSAKTARFQGCRATVFDWSKANVRGAPWVLYAVTAAVAAAETAIAADRAKEMNGQTRTGASVGGPLSGRRNAPMACVVGPIRPTCLD